MTIFVGDFAQHFDGIDETFKVVNVNRIDCPRSVALVVLVELLFPAGFAAPRQIHIDDSVVIGG